MKKLIGLLIICVMYFSCIKIYNGVDTGSGCSTCGDSTIVKQDSIVTPPTIGAITHPTCNVATGTVFLSNLPSTGNWTLMRSPGGIAISGSGKTFTVCDLLAGTYTFTVTNSKGLTSQTSASVVINENQGSPIVPIVVVTQPTCSLPTGSVVISNLPATGTWTLNPGNITGTGVTKTITGLVAGTYNYTVTNSSGCVSGAVTIIITDFTPITAPIVGTVTQPTCSVPTGSVILSGLPATGTWTLNPGNITGSGTTKTITGLVAGTYNYTVTTAGTCISPASVTVTISPVNSTVITPTIGSITQPTCSVQTGSVVITSLPSSGTWTLNPGNITGSGTTKTITGLVAGTYNYTVTNAGGCTSAPLSFTIQTPPVVPPAPIIGCVTQPTCSVATGSVVINGLPATGTWSLLRMPSNVTITGTGTSKTITGLTAGTYTFIVTSASGCSSTASTSVTINVQPVTPNAPIIGTIIQPTATVKTGSVTITGLPATGVWTLIRTPGNIKTTGTGTSVTITGLSPTDGLAKCYSVSYTWVVLYGDCTSAVSGTVTIKEYY